MGTPPPMAVAYDVKWPQVYCMRLHVMMAVCLQRNQG
jgi:hypothetical protein